MENLIKKFEKFHQEIVQRIEELIVRKGVESEFSEKTVLSIMDVHHMYNIEGGRYLVEISPTNLIDNSGYTYSHDAITIEKLCQAIDSI